VQRSAKTRSMNQARLEAEKQDKINRGETPAPAPTVKSHLTVEAGVKVWLGDRTAQNIGNRKAIRMGKILVEWVRERGGIWWKEITPLMMTEFFAAMSQRFASEHSGSLKIRWSIDNPASEARSVQSEAGDMGSTVWVPDQTITKFYKPFTTLFARNPSASIKTE